MKEKTYFFNGMQKKIKLLATSLLCVGHAALLLATHNMEEALLQTAQSLKLSMESQSNKNFYVVTNEDNREVGKRQIRGALNKGQQDNKHWVAFSAATTEQQETGFTLTDYKAEGYDGGDQVYKHQPMKEKLPRGLAAVKDPSGTLLHQLCGLRKFDY